MVGTNQTATKVSTPAIKDTRVRKRDCSMHQNFLTFVFMRGLNLHVCTTAADEKLIPEQLKIFDCEISQRRK